MPGHLFFCRPQLQSYGTATESYGTSNEKYFFYPCFYWIPIQTGLMTGYKSRYLATLKFHNFVMSKYFLGV